MTSNVISFIIDESYNKQYNLFGLSCVVTTDFNKLATIWGEMIKTIASKRHFAGFGDSDGPHHCDDNYTLRGDMISQISKLLSIKCFNIVKKYDTSLQLITKISYIELFPILIIDIIKQYTKIPNKTFHFKFFFEELSDEKSGFYENLLTKIYDYTHIDYSFEILKKNSNNHITGIPDYLLAVIINFITNEQKSDVSSFHYINFRKVELIYSSLIIMEDHMATKRLHLSKKHILNEFLKSAGNYFV